LSGFRAFLLETNALALAIGVIIGTALGTVVTSLVNDIIMPPIGLALGGVDFTQLKIVLRAATGGDPATEVAIRWGLFLNAVIAFIIVAFVVWQISRMFIKEEAAKQVEVLRAEHGDRRIVSWSQHDLEVVRTLRDGDPEPRRSRSRRLDAQ
jgi:large conductance mechanosensitive channel